MKQAKILSFPAKKHKSRKKCVNINGVKYFTEKEIKMLRRSARNDSDLAKAKGLIHGVRSWMVIDLLTCTGLRVSEAANLRIKDLKISHGKSEIFVCGKCNISGTIQIPVGLKKHLKSYLKWKQDRGEGVQADDFLFIGQRGKMTAQAIQQIVKRYLKDIGIYESGKSVHALRHSYAMQLYAKEKDIRACQKQLRHVSIQSTMIYADVSKDEIQEQVKGLWN
jgi:integrase/recombinase XerD